MSNVFRIAIVSTGLLSALASLLFGQAMFDQLSSETAEVLSIEQKWLMGASVLYGISTIVAWHFRGSFSLSASRMLIWAIIAFLALSHCIDIIGAYRSEIPSVFGLGDSRLTPQTLLGLRVRALNMGSIIIMGIISIGVGFEVKET